MKTFFLALVLGIFIGSIATNYFASPDAYQKLKQAKQEMLRRPGFPDPEPSTSDATLPPTEEAETEPDSGEPEVAGPVEDEAEALDADANATPTPGAAVPTDEPNADNSPLSPTAPPEGQIDAAPQPRPDEENTAEEPPAAEKETPTVGQKVDKLIEEGSEKAEEMAEAAKETFSEAAEKAAPVIEESIDLGLAAAIRTQFKLEKRLSEARIQIEVEKRRVVLKGSVPSQEAKRLAIEIAVFTKGVDRVEEELTIAAP